MGGVIAPSASVTGTSVPWQILLPAGQCSSRAGRPPPPQPSFPKLQTALCPLHHHHPPPPSPPLESIRCCSQSYYRYAPAKCKTSICHLSARRAMKTSHYAAAPLPAPPTPFFFTSHGFRSYFDPFPGLLRGSLRSWGGSPISIADTTLDLWEFILPLFSLLLLLLDETIFQYINIC